jgi:hypothetical protein
MPFSTVTLHLVVDLGDEPARLPEHKTITPAGHDIAPTPSRSLILPM